MADAERPLTLSASHSHLYRGARVVGAESETALPLRPSAVQLSFSDGIDVDAELLEGMGPGSLALAVPAYETATGHPVAAALWPVAEVGAGEVADRLTLRLGQRIE